MLAGLTVSIEEEIYVRHLQGFFVNNKELFFCTRYVDNRLVVVWAAEEVLMADVVKNWNNFYQAPVELEHVTSKDATEEITHANYKEADLLRQEADLKRFRSRPDPTSHDVMPGTPAPAEAKGSRPGSDGTAPSLKAPVTVRTDGLREEGMVYPVSPGLSSQRAGESSHRAKRNDEWSWMMRTFGATEPSSRPQLTTPWVCR
eukprot:s3966_g4.t1